MTNGKPLSKINSDDHTCEWITLGGKRCTNKAGSFWYISYDLAPANKAGSFWYISYDLLCNFIHAYCKHHSLKLELTPSTSRHKLTLEENTVIRIMNQ